MTKKDYIKIAHAFVEGRLSRPGNVKPLNKAEEDQWKTLRLFIADTLAADNPRFDRTRFYVATEE